MAHRSPHDIVNQSLEKNQVPSSKEARDKERWRPLAFDYSASLADAKIRLRQPEMMTTFTIRGQLISNFQRSDHCMSKIIMECREYLHRHVVSTIEATDLSSSYLEPRVKEKVILRPLPIT